MIRLVLISTESGEYEESYDRIKWSVHTARTCRHYFADIYFNFNFILAVFVASKDMDISDNRVLSMDYNSYGKSSERHCAIEPYLTKEEVLHPSICERPAQL